MHCVHFSTLLLSQFPPELRGRGSVKGQQRLSPVFPDPTRAPVRGCQGSHWIWAKHHCGQPPLSSWNLDFLLSYTACPAAALSHTPGALSFVHC